MEQRDEMSSLVLISSPRVLWASLFVFIFLLDLGTELITRICFSSSLTLTYLWYVFTETPPRLTHESPSPRSCSPEDLPANGLGILEWSLTGKVFGSLSKFASQPWLSLSVPRQTQLRRKKGTATWRGSSYQNASGPGIALRVITFFLSFSFWLCRNALFTHYTLKQ